MASLRDLRRRIRSVKNTAQITRAMEMVAASRMRRAQSRVLAARPYAEAIGVMIANVAGQARPGDLPHPLMQRRPIERVGVAVFTTDRGLCGALNSNLIRRASELILEQTGPVELVTVGRKGQDFFIRRGYHPLATFTGMGDRPDYMDLVPVARVLMDAFVEGTVDAVYLVYPRFVSTLVQRPEVEQVLPIHEVRMAGLSGDQRPGRPVEYIYEPDPRTILSALLPRYVEVVVFQAMLETAASEQSARMVAMRNATENAKELIQSLTLTYNKERQASITREVTEIASASEALAARR